MSGHRIVPAAIGVLFILCAAGASGAQEPGALFGKKCSGCHTVGHGDRIGPDLKGATDRRTRAWLRTWVRSSQRLIDARDPTAVALFEKFKREQMPDQDLSPDDIDGVLDFVAAGGPLTGATSRPRNAATATAADISMGRDLFTGARQGRSGGAPCASCHLVRVRGAPSGGTYAPDLTHVYSRFQDPALSEFLKRPCSPRAFAIDDGTQLTDAEIFAVKAFLHDVDVRASGSDRSGGSR